MSELSEEQTWLEVRDAEVVNVGPHPVPPPALEALRRVLASGLAVTPDPQRARFCEALVDGFYYYLCVLPTRRVLVLARWPAR